MCGWMRQSADLLELLYGKLKDFVLAQLYAVKKRARQSGIEGADLRFLRQELPYRCWHIAQEDGRYIPSRVNVQGSRLRLGRFQISGDRY
jgi:hypothetical protein